MADSHRVLMTRGLGSAGISVEEKTPTTGKREERCQAMQTENRPLMTVNTHPRLDADPSARPGIGAFVTSIRKGADERQ